MKLYRPTGLPELRLVLRAELRRWPPRLPGQPIFYPVLNAPYAAQIAREWNTQADPFAGYVTAFEVSDSHAKRYERRVVGGKQHEELWVPAEELPAFNEHIQSTIRVTQAFFGNRFSGFVPDKGGFRARNAREQFEVLRSQYSYSKQDFHGEITLNREAVFLHLPYWEQTAILEPNPSTADTLAAIRETWSGAFPSIPLPEAAV